MIPHQFFYPLVVLGLLWLFVMLHYAWPSRCVASPHKPAKPIMPPRKRSSDPKPFPHRWLIRRLGWLGPIAMLLRSLFKLLVRFVQLAIGLGSQHVEEQIELRHRSRAMRFPSFTGAYAGSTHPTRADRH